MTTIHDAFETVTVQQQALDAALDARNYLLAPVIVAIKACFTWAHVDQMKKHGWCPRMHPENRPLEWRAEMLTDDKIWFYCYRCFEGSARHGSEDLEFELEVAVPVSLIEANNLDDLIAYVKKNANTS